MSGHKYYYLSESFREEGRAHPQQRVVAYLGRYQEAVVAIERMRHLSGEQKQNYLIKLATLEGRYSTEIPLQQKVYSCLVIDPPWHYELRKADETHRNRIPYRSMALNQILDLPVPELSERAGCVLWLWYTNNHAAEAVKCLERWRFELKTILTWEKVTKAGTPHIGTGHWLRNCTEHCFLATRGKVSSFAHTKLLTNQSTILRAPRTEHSRKPEAFYQLVEQLCQSSKLEMFARRKREGWDSWGDELTNQLNVSAKSASSQAKLLYPQEGRSLP